VRKLALVVIASALLSSGCVGRTVIPDPRVPHQVAREGKVTIWVETKDGKKVKQKVRITEGWWIASPLVVE
jgi:hypothetical protein